MVCDNTIVPHVTHGLANMPRGDPLGLTISHDMYRASLDLEYLMQDNVGPERSIDTVGVDTVTGDAASLANTGIRAAYRQSELDPPTEEIVLDPELILEPSEVSLDTVAQPPLELDRPRKSSMPPPLPLDALRTQSTSPKSVRELRDALRSGAERKITRATPPPLPSRRGATPPPVAASDATAATEPHPAQLALERLARQMRERDAYLSELESMFAQRSEALLAAEAREAGLLARVEQLEAQVRELQQAPPSAAPARDDLRRIRGIGPGFERALHALGVDSFAAIASWTEADVARIGAALDVKAGRIQRDRWIAQARELAGLAAESGTSDAS
jgi:predicted flap endonuclease-1-like 5' DNA nuclease